MFTGNADDEPAEVKLRIVTRYFLEESTHNFYTVLVRKDENETGYYLQMIAPDDFEYTTFLDNVYLTSVTAISIIETIEAELDKLVL